ncbi:MAG: hypothetical protein K1X57_21740 [Gemmataceae bacterium]|nr:hypothetical protein [Gemmataceae bacterium]
MCANRKPRREIRSRVLSGGLSKRQACEQYQIRGKTLAKIRIYKKSLG